MARQPHSDPDRFWPSCDDEQPGVSIRPLSQADLAALLAHLDHDQDQDHLRRSGGSAPVVAVRVRASVGRPGASAAAEYQRRRAIELATWAGSLPWRVVALVAASVAAWLTAARIAPDLAALAGVTVAAGLGWLLRFRSSPDTVAWRRGVAGERRTARLLAPLERRGWAVLHDLAIPNSAANIDHLVIGPGGVMAIDSKQYRGQLQVDRDGMVWYGRHLLVSALRTTLWEADQADEVLGIADTRSPPSPPSTAPASPGGCCGPTGSSSSRPGGCPTCCRGCRPSLGRSGWPGWRIGPGCGSAPPPDSLPREGPSDRPRGRTWVAFRERKDRRRATRLPGLQSMAAVGSLMVRRSSMAR
jgi:hypothetical protein